MVKWWGALMIGFVAWSATARAADRAGRLTDELPARDPDEDIEVRETSRAIIAARLPHARFRRLTLGRRP